MLAIGGLSGSGKTTLALNLASHIGEAPGAVVLRSDVLRKQMFDQPLERPLPKSAYTPDETERVYRRLFELLEMIVGAGRSVICDAVSLQSSERSALADLADRMNVPFQGIWLNVSPAVQEDRLRARRGDASDADVEVARWQRQQDAGIVDWTTVDADGSEDDVLERTLAALTCNST